MIQGASAADSAAKNNFCTFLPKNFTVKFCVFLPNFFVPMLHKISVKISLFHAFSVPDMQLHRFLQKTIAFVRAPCCFDGLLRAVFTKIKGVFGLFRGPVTGRCDE